MRGTSRRGLALASALTSAAFAATVALAGSAAAVAGTADAEYDCGSWGSGTATLTSADDGTTKTIQLDSTDITAPVEVDLDTVTSTLKLAKGSGGQVEFSGTVNNPMGVGDPVTVGPLALTGGTLAAGDTTDSVVLSGAPSESNWSLRIVAPAPDGSTVTVYCTATSAQTAPTTW